MSLVYRARFLFVLFGKGTEQKDSIGEEAFWVFFFGQAFCGCSSTTSTCTRKLDRQVVLIIILYFSGPFFVMVRCREVLFLSERERNR
jgi:hypothetical protein